MKGVDFPFVFARFVHFYHMTDEQVLDMPAHRFWCLESQISRIRSERDLRTIFANSATVSEKGAKEVVRSLTLSLGDIHQMDRAAIVPPEPEAAQKLAKLAQTLNRSL